MRENLLSDADPLSDVISLVKARSLITGRLAAGGPWAFASSGPEEVKFLAIVKGTCYIQWEGDPSPLCLETGDVILLTDKRSFVIGSDLSVPPADSATLREATVDGVVTIGRGDEFLMLGGHIHFESAQASLLVDALPVLVHVRGSSPEAAVVQQFLHQLYGELEAERAGNRLASTMLTQLIFLHALRSHLKDSVEANPGWLRALGDDRIAPALRLIHGEPGRAWSLEELARSAYLSKSAFALRFKTVAGVAPLAYLTNWRMRLAEKALLEGGTPVSSLAYSLGYTSESAFSNAFKRVVGMAPKHYRSALRA